MTAELVMDMVERLDRKMQAVSSEAIRVVWEPGREGLLKALDGLAEEIWRVRAEVEGREG